MGLLRHRDNEVGDPPIADKRGIPPDGFRVEGLDDDERRAVLLDGGSWLSVRELLAFDRDATFVGTFRIKGENEDDFFSYDPDRKAATEITLRRFLGRSFFDELARLAASGAERIVFFYGLGSRSEPVGSSWRRGTFGVGPEIARCP